MKILLALLISLLSINLVMAVTIDSVETSRLTPGSEGSLSVIIENTLDEDIEDVSLQLQFTDLPITPVGSSERSVSDIDEGDNDKLSFRVRISSEVLPGDYEITYTLSYRTSNGLQSKEGSFGIRIGGEPELVYSLSADNPVENQQGKISLKIVNKGFADARFVSVKVTSNDFVLLSEEEVYIGTVDSDDFETAEFEVLFDRNPAQFKVAVEYKDFENQDRTALITLPVTIYSREEALQLGIIKKNPVPAVIIVVIVLLAALLIWRAIKRRRRLNNSLNRS